jgi:hypothetical protein
MGKGVVVLGIKKLPETDEWKLTVKINGKYNEDESYYTDSSLDFIRTADSEANKYADMGYELRLTKGFESFIKDKKSELGVLGY